MWRREALSIRRLTTNWSVGTRRPNSHLKTLTAKPNRKLETGRGPSWSPRGVGDGGDGRARDKTQNQGETDVGGGTLPGAAGCVKQNCRGSRMSERPDGAYQSLSPGYLRIRSRRKDLRQAGRGPDPGVSRPDAGPSIEGVACTPAGGDPGQDQHGSDLWLGR